MSKHLTEVLAVLVTVLGIAGAALWPFSYERGSVSGRHEQGTPVITLTAVAASGTWTDAAVDGGNYWSGTFRAARPVLVSGRTTILRLKSADVIHTFYCPGLGIGPVEVYPGHVAEVSVTPEKQGCFTYYCTTICGDPHFGMRGEVVVSADSAAAEAAEKSPAPAPSGPGKYWLEPPPPQGATLVQRGSWLFRYRGCVACHGAEGRGGVPDWNYVKLSVPPLNTLAERIMLFDQEDAKKIVALLARGAVIESLKESPPVPKFNIVLAQYQAVRDVIRNGSPAGKKDPNGLEPPLEMPAWRQRLTDSDINAVIVYLLTLQPWEDEDKESDK